MFTQVCNIGRVEKRQSKDGKSILSLALAYQYGRKVEGQEKPTQWLETAIFGNQADTLAEYLNKGDKIQISLKDLHIETFQDRDGNQRSKLTGTFLDVQFVARAKEKSDAPAPAPRPAPAPKPAPTKNQFDDMDDDIPFN